MKMPICSRCKKNVAIVFISRMENGKTINDGLCLKCAKELKIQPVSDLIDRMGLVDEDLEGLSEEMLQSLSGMGGLIPREDGEEPDCGDECDECCGNSAAPFLDKLFGEMQPSRQEEGEGAPKEGERPAKKDKKRKYLETYSINLTQRAKDGKLDRVIGREAELGRVIQILNRRQKNNPCLIGEPGVGKTAVAEALAQRIVEGSVPAKLKDKEVCMLDLTALVAGTQFRGQFESRMKGLIEEVKRLKNIILVIDEVHNLVGAGDADGSMNAANILKPALSRGEIQVVGATTFAEYRKHIEKDAALERRFQPVTVDEPSIEDSVEIIKGIRGYYEAYHGVTISDETARQAVLLSERYITDRFLPDKAIDLIDEASSSLNLRNAALAREVEIKKELAEAREEQEALMAPGSGDTGAYQRLAYLRSRQLRLEDELAGLAGKTRLALTTEDLARVIELWTKIPASRVCEQEYARLSGQEERLRARVIGQDEAISALTSAIRRSRVGLSPKHKPVSFIFVGPTGVGKTELVKCLAADMFDTPEALIRLDMSEYMEKHSVSKLIGSPPGYIGYDEAGQLTEKVRRRPYSVVLFDEIEKAHPDVLNVLLQILDDGRATDAQGRQVSFENTIIIMTSNAGSDRRDGSVGFDRTISEQRREKAMKALSDIMRPEFLNRVDEIIAFNQLSREDFSRIALLMLGDLKKAMEERGIRLSWDDALVSLLVEKSYSVRFGARNLRRLIQKEVEDGVAALIISRFDDPVTGVHLSAAEGAVKIDAV